MSLKTSLRGNITYSTTEIEADHLEDDGSHRAKWETNRVIEHPREHEEATKVRSKARSLVSSICTPSSFGLLCPESSRDKLLDAVSEARAVVDEFNRQANVTQVAVYVIVGRVAADDAEAVRAINGEVRDLLADMERGLRNLDVEAVRQAASKAKALSSMMTAEAALRMRTAVEAARTAARQIVKAGEQAAIAIDIEIIQQSRAAFLDLEEAAPVQQPAAAARAIDLDVAPDMPIVASAPAVVAPSLEF